MTEVRKLITILNKKAIMIKRKLIAMQKDPPN